MKQSVDHLMHLSILANDDDDDADGEEDDDDDDDEHWMHLSNLTKNKIG